MHLHISLAFACRSYIFLTLFLYHFDIETAFLNPEIDKQLYIEQPVRFEVPGFEDHIIFKLSCGLKQSAVLWSNELNKIVSLPRFFAIEC